MKFQIEYALDRLHKRTLFHELLYKLLWVAYDKGLRLIIENPATAPNYLITGQNFPTPTIVDNNRMDRGDVFKKPTAYWFVNCDPTTGKSFQRDKEQKFIDKCKCSPQAGICSEERSMIHPDYARNFICDFRKKHPDLWRELQMMSAVENKSYEGFVYTRTFAQIEQKMDAFDNTLRLF